MNGQDPPLPPSFPPSQGPKEDDQWSQRDCEQHRFGSGSQIRLAGSLSQQLLSQDQTSGVVVGKVKAERKKVVGCFLASLSAESADGALHRSPGVGGVVLALL